MGFYVTRPRRQGGWRPTLCMYFFYIVSSSMNSAYMILCVCIVMVQIPPWFGWTAHPVYQLGIVLLTLIAIAGTSPPL
jgi:hypothetical protein